MEYDLCIDGDKIPAYQKSKNAESILEWDAMVPPIPRNNITGHTPYEASNHEVLGKTGLHY